MSDPDSRGFGVYVHWPFCAAKCPYCDFNSHVRREVDQDRWRRALVRAIGVEAERTQGRVVDSVFFGGGTPSLMPPETVAAVIAEIKARWTVSPDVEITLEANPTSIEAGRFAGYRDAGVNRVSMGAQALNDADLRALGRTHSAAEARAAFDVARAAFDRVSFDLIYARVGQTEAAWRAELSEALSMAVDHLSLYQLTIEPGTRFIELYKRGKLRPPIDDAAAEMYETTQELCDAAGMPAYEISNHARPGAESRHNLIYWRMGDYVGVGPGAHGRLTLPEGRFATETIRAPEAWLSASETDGLGAASCLPVDPQDQGLEALMMGLRVAEGINLDHIASLGGVILNQDAIDLFCDEGLLQRDKQRLSATSAGRLLLDRLLSEIIS